MIFLISAKIQDGRQNLIPKINAFLHVTQKFMMAAKKWQQSDFCEMSPVHSEDTLPVKNFIKIALSRTVSKMHAFYAGIQDGRLKWRESDFYEKSPVDSADNLQVRNFVEIALSRTVSEIYAFLHFTHKFNMAAKSGRKAIFA